VKMRPAVLLDSDTTEGQKSAGQVRGGACCATGFKILDLCGGKQGRGRTVQRCWCLSLGAHSLVDDDGVDAVPGGGKQGRGRTVQGCRASHLVRMRWFTMTGLMQSRGMRYATSLSWSWMLDRSSWGENTRYTLFE